MTNLLQTLFRIDPTEGFIQYVKTVKPYHSKILDVLVEYVYTDKVAVQVKEKWQMAFEFTRPDVDTVYSCGYGYRWDPTGMTAPESVPTARILTATAQVTSANANSFLVEPPTFSTYHIVVADRKSNQLAFALPFTITNVNVTARTFTVLGEVTADHFDVNKHIYVSNNTGAGVDGRYDVVSVSSDGTTSVVTVKQQISLLTTVSGCVNVPMVFDQLPYWPSGTTVKVTTTNTLPQTLVTEHDYHFIPQEKAGLFSLATKRYPDQFEDFVDLTTLGVGSTSIVRTEPFVPGDTVVVSGTKQARNDGTYIIGTITKEADNFRLHVLQRIRRSTTFDQQYDGTVSLVVDTFSLPSYCAVAKSSDMHAEAFVHEDLRFSFEISMSDAVSASLWENNPNAETHTADLPGTTVISAATLVPHGFDTQFFDVGGM